MVVLLFVLLIGLTQLEFSDIKSEYQYHISDYFPLCKLITSLRESSKICFWGILYIWVEFIFARRQRRLLKVRLKPFGACFQSCFGGFKKWVLQNKKSS